MKFKPAPVFFKHKILVITFLSVLNIIKLPPLVRLLGKPDSTFTISSPSFLSRLSCNQFCSEPFPLPIHLTSLHITTPIPRVRHGTVDKIIWLALFYLSHSVSNSIHSFPTFGSPTTPLQPQTTSLAINQSLVLKGYFISSTKGNQYPQHCKGAYVCTLSISHKHSRWKKDHPDEQIFVRGKICQGQKSCLQVI